MGQPTAAIPDVLVYGGEQWQLPDFPTPQRFVVTSELYDPATGTWSPK